MSLNSRGASTKTRIETARGAPCMTGCVVIQEAHPLKQGLKQEIGSTMGYDAFDSRGASTKTRIETL